MERPQLSREKIREVILQTALGGTAKDEALRFRWDKPAEILREFQLKLESEPPAERKDSYGIEDLTRHHGIAFLKNAYRVILGREPDPAGQEGYLEALRTGKIDKVDVIARLRFSEEGRQRGVHVRGLWTRAFIRKLGRLPLFGPCVRFIIDAIELPALRRDMQKLELLLSEAIASIARYLGEQNELQMNHLSDLEAILARLEVNQRTGAEALARTQNELAEMRQSMQGDLRTLGLRLDSEIELERSERAKLWDQIFAARTQLERQRQEISRLHDDLKDKTLEMNTQMQKLRAELTERMNAFEAPWWEERSAQSSRPISQSEPSFYVALTDRFRGSTAEIRRRCERYLPYLQSVSSITTTTPLIDLGCGRGEWLSLLQEKGISAIGVDNNPIFIQRCRAAGLQVFGGDALEYLAGLPNAGAGAITAFHLLEHLSLDEILGLMSEVIRVLRPGGFFLVETPNPENALVGSHYFYLDPTHRHPIPAQLMQLFFEWHGFGRIETHYLHPWESAMFQTQGEIASRLNELLYGPMDYAVIGWKI